MRIPYPLIAGLIAANLLVACAAPSGQDTSADASAQATAPMQAPEPTNAVAQHASATGIITAIDPAAKTITIDHGPVPALEWPAMTMTFQAGGVDLNGFSAGDPISFEFSASGMTAELTALRHQ